jgi:hypothetical protein
MSPAGGDPQGRFLVLAIVMLALAAGAIKWAGRALRAQLGAGARRSRREFTAGMVDDVPPALVKRALERGLVTPAQIAGMNADERRFVFASLRAQLGEASPAPGPAKVSAARPPGGDARSGPSGR